MKDAPKLTQSERKRAAIIAAAAQEFRVAGFAATSMDRISERASVSKRTVYNHFSGKEALFQAILEVLWAGVHEATEVPFDPKVELEEQLRELALRELEMLADENYLGLARAMMAEAIRSPELAAKAWGDLHAREAGLTTWIRSAVAHGRLTVADPVFAAEQFTALIKAFAFWPQMIGSIPVPTPRERKQLASEAASMFLAKYQAK
jgi:TetR/AcrR family transcriptional regulator, regulator of autoinduction and epiphytic fitness